MAYISTANSLTATNPCLGVSFVPFSGKGFTLSSSRRLGESHKSTRGIQGYHAKPYSNIQHQNDLNRYLSDLNEAKQEIAHHGEKIRSLELRVSLLTSNINLDLQRYENKYATESDNRMNKSSSYPKENFSSPDPILHSYNNQDLPLIKNDDFRDRVPISGSLNISTEQDCIPDITQYHELSYDPLSSSAPHHK